MRLRPLFVEAGVMFTRDWVEGGALGGQSEGGIAKARIPAACLGRSRSHACYSYVPASRAYHCHRRGSCGRVVMLLVYPMLTCFHHSVHAPTGRRGKRGTRSISAMVRRGVVVACSVVGPALALLLASTTPAAGRTVRRTPSLLQALISCPCAHLLGC